MTPVTQVTPITSPAQSLETTPHGLAYRSPEAL
jgi:hypothetical protein